jgi:cobalt-zinc-cadmium resistance protein CzcA
VDRVRGQQNLTATIDRQALARHGLNASDIHDFIEAAVGGQAATKIHEGERRFQAAVRFPESLRDSARDIASILINPPDGAQLPLGSLAHVELKEGAPQIRREDGKRRVIVGVNVRNRDLGGFAAELQKTVESKIQLPAGYYYEWGGQFENMERARRHLMIIVPITSGAILFLLFLLFRSPRFAALDGFFDDQPSGEDIQFRRLKQKGEREGVVDVATDAGVEDNGNLFGGVHGHRSE